MLTLRHPDMPVSERPRKGQPERTYVDTGSFEASYGARPFICNCPLRACLFAVRAAMGRVVPDLYLVGGPSDDSPLFADAGGRGEG